MDLELSLSAHATDVANSRFWNTVWLFANDLIVGYALSAFVRENSRYLSQVVETLVQASFIAFSLILVHYR